MSIETYQFNLPITPGSIPPVLHLSQYDSGRTFTAILRDDANVPFELDSGATAVIKGRNAAGIAWQQDCTVSGANVTFTPSGAATDQSGVMPVTIEITESEEVISPLCVVFHIQKAGYTNEEAVLSPDFETAIEAAVAQAISEGGLGFSDEFKQALLDVVDHIIWDDDDGPSRYSNLQAVLYGVESVTATFTPGSYTIFDTNTLDDLRQFLVVTAVVVGESVVITDYTLSGEMDAGTNTITAEYGGKTTTFSVTVVSTALPEGYTAYDYIEGKTTTETSTSQNNFIWLNNQTDMQALSLDIMLMQKDSTASSLGVLGARNATGTADNSVSVYHNSSGLTVSTRNKWTGSIGTVPTAKPLRFELINPETSPYYWRIDGGELHEVEWDTSTTVPYGFSLFNNIPHGSTSNMGRNGHIRIGRIILRNYSGECVGYYRVCTYSGKIGMYDLISETFQTAVNANAVTINNSGCLWAVGNWT